jgi:RsiW-degrading membrane proteinase PrsW (M82 family)
VSDHEDAVVDDEPMAVAAEPGASQDPHDHIKRWTLVLVLVAAWIVAAIIGLALYLWWYHSIDKTPALFVVLVYLVVCTVAAMLTAMVQNKPLVSALAIALVSAPFASTAAASVLYGIYYCDRLSRCLVGLIPY